MKHSVKNNFMMAFHEYLDLQKLAGLCVITGIFLIMISVSLMDKLLMAAVILMILNKDYHKQFATLLKNPMIISAVILVLLTTAGVFYSKGSWKNAFHEWDKYIKILYPLFFLPLFLDSRWRRYAITGLICGVLIGEVCAYLHFYGIANFGFSKTYHWFVHDIDGSFIVAYVCYLLLNLIIDEKKFRWVYLCILIFCGYDLLFMNEERTGYLVFISLSGLLLLQRLGWRGLLIATLVIPITVGTIYTVSPKFHDRVNLIYSDIHGYAKKGDQTTSIGLRLAFANYSFKIIKEYPIFGAGTGSFKELYQELNGPKLDGNAWPGHPHNEYLAVLLQLGVVGFILFLSWVWIQIQESRNLPLFEKRLIHGLILGFLILSLCHASLSVSPGSNLYVILLAVFLAAKFTPDMMLNESKIEKKI